MMKGEPICPTRNCPAGAGMDLYDVLKNDFKAAYVFIDNSKVNGTLPADNTPKFVGKLESDKRFKKVFTDPKYPDIVVYKI